MKEIAAIYFVPNQARELQRLHLPFPPISMWSNNTHAPAQRRQLTSKNLVVKEGYRATNQLMLCLHLFFVSSDLKVDDRALQDHCSQSI